MVKETFRSLKPIRGHKLKKWSNGFFFIVGKFQENIAFLHSTNPCRCQINVRCHFAPVASIICKNNKWGANGPALSKSGQDEECFKNHSVL